MPEQVKRLLILSVILVGSFLILRSFLIPDSFGEFGHYRGDVLNEIQSLEVKYQGETVCLDCHEDYGEFKKVGLHAEISCESCHGPGWKHIEDPNPENILLPEGREFCGLCHNKNAARDAREIAQVDLNEHNSESDCMECHNPHAPWQ